jgi:hypothetical protein
MCGNMSYVNLDEELILSQLIPSEKCASVRDAQPSVLTTAHSTVSKIGTMVMVLYFG